MNQKQEALCVVGFVQSINLGGLSAPLSKLLHPSSSSLLVPLLPVLLSLFFLLHLLVLCHHYLHLLLWASFFSPLVLSFPGNDKTFSFNLSPCLADLIFRVQTKTHIPVE